jgi:undecaprenyl diphosphate synthase
MPSHLDVTLPKGTKVPNHVAIIPDGNRRWARSRGLPTFEGHRIGFDAAVKLAKAARKMGIHTVTLWGFSTENWDRTPAEIAYLMKLYETLIQKYLKDALEDDTRIIHLGRKDRLPRPLIRKIENAEEKTKNCKSYIANIAIDFGGQDDIIRAVKRMIHEGVKEDEVTKDLFDKYTDLHNQPYPYVDLMIRTSGEQRTSGFLMWNAPYAEFYWENDHFPDFTAEKLKEAVLDYSRRRRRFGGNDAEEHLKFKPQMTAKLELAWWRLSKIPEGTGFSEYVVKHMKEQYGLSKELAKEAGVLMAQAFLEGKHSKWEKAKKPLKKFYILLKDELKLAFEPSIAASLDIKLWQGMEGKEKMSEALDVEEAARQYYAEVYRISLFQASKAAHLRVLAGIERNLAEAGYGEEHWAKAEAYLEKFYSALKERVA